jgi:hypothetical protein
MGGHRRSRRRRGIRRCLLSVLAFATLALFIWLLRLRFPVLPVILTTILLGTFGVGERVKPEIGPREERMHFNLRFGPFSA